MSFADVLHLSPPPSLPSLLPPHLIRLSYLLSLLPLSPPLLPPQDWAASNYPKPHTSTAEWLHKAIDRSVS